LSLDHYSKAKIGSGTSCEMEEWIRYRLMTEDLVVRGIDNTYDEIKLRAALAVVQWESLWERARIFKKEIREAKEKLFMKRG
jgi:hypothetical protein